MTTTKHACGGPAFGKLTAGCPRCDELAAGAEPRKQPWRKTETQRRAERQAFRSDFRRELDRCWREGTVCTFGDW